MRLAEWEKLWRPEILWAEAARNKAARLGQAQAAEKVRNVKSGWCWSGKPAQRLPKLRNAERTQNLKGGAINFLVACLAPGPCTDGNVNALATFLKHLGAFETMVGGKLSAPLADSDWGFGSNHESARRPKAFRFSNDASASAKVRKMRPTSSFGKWTSEVVVQPYPFSSLGWIPRCWLRLSDGWDFDSRR